MTNRKCIPKQLKIPLESEQFSYQYFLEYRQQQNFLAFLCSTHKEQRIEEYSAAEFPASNTGQNKGRWQTQASTFEIL